MKKREKKRNATDLTLRNIRQANRRLARLEAEYDILKARVDAIDDIKARIQLADLADVRTKRSFVS